MDFGDILGNETLKKHFRTAVHQGKTTQAYIIEGDKGSGKKSIAKCFAKLLLCENTGVGSDSVDFCKTCDACVKCDSGSNFDIIMVTHEKATTITVGEIRQQVVSDVDKKPIGKYKIYIIDDAELMNVQAQNAILKTIEEPPEYVVVIMLVNHRSALLPTILSRCVILQTKPVEKSLVKAFIQKKYGVSDDMAEYAAGCSMGNIGKACRILSSEQYMKMRGDMIGIARDLCDIRIWEICERCEGLKEWKNSYVECIDILTGWFRDLLIAKSVRGKKNYLNVWEKDIIAAQSLRVSYRGINESLSYIEKTKDRIGRNVSFQAAMEMMFIRIAELIRG